MPPVCVHIPIGYVKNKSIPTTRPEFLLFCSPTLVSETGFPHPFSPMPPGRITQGKTLPPANSSTVANIYLYLCYRFIAFSTKGNKITSCSKTRYVYALTFLKAGLLHYTLMNIICKIIHYYCTKDVTGLPSAKFCSLEEKQSNHHPSQ